MKFHVVNWAAFFWLWLVSFIFALSAGFFAGMAFSVIWFHVGGR